MAATASSTSMCARPDWVAFSDEPGQTDDHSVMQMASCPADSSAWTEAPPVAVQQRSSWVQFDEKSWSPSPPPPQVKGPRHSVCSSASFWSAVQESEEYSSVSMGASSSDLPSLATEEPPSHDTSRPHSPNSSVCQEDEGMNMDTLNWTANNSHTNGQPYISSSRFASWVTFDDDEMPDKHVSKPSNIKLDNLNKPPLQDANSNLIISPFRNQGTDRHILDLTPDSTHTVFDLDSPLLNSSTPYTKKNPFLDEEFSNMQPSSINPFSAYFNKTELKSTESNGSENVFSFSPSVFEPQSADIKRESLLLFSSDSDSAGGHDLYPPGPTADDLDQFRNMQISDPDQVGSATLPDDSVDAVDEDETPYQPTHMAPQNGWPMLLRIPEKKNIMSSRHWGPIFVRLSDAGQLQLFYEKGLEKPFKEFQLNAQLELSDHKLQNYEENGRVHTLSLDQVVYKEKRKIQPKVAVVHLPVKEQLVKLGTIDYQDFLSFRYALQEKLVCLSVDTDSISSSVSYSEEEIQVEVVDSFYGVLSKGDNRILEQLVTTRVNVLAFLTGSPLCRIGLNDIQVKGKEVVSRHDIIPNTTTRWIRLRDCRLHECADQSEFDESRIIAYDPPAGRRFELLRFRTAYAEKMLPFTLRTVVSVRGAEVELQSWLVMSTGFSSNRDPLTLIPCENVAVRYPIPEIWAKNFRKDSVTGEKSLKARFNKGASFGSTSSSGSEPAMRVTLGTAKYEQAFKSVVWRISRLPDKNSALGHPHTFFCRLELGSDWEVPRKFQCQVEVEFDMPAASASKATVRSLSVEGRTELKKWITYKAHYSYQVGIEQKNEGMDSPEQEQPGECSQQ
ncbi:stonin-2 isoform X1 [Pygocentrus nattereri]|uniref:Stonin-2 n=2 Tax=Pygocentrus nattereri TaxID=42514 RepID=A0A3B4D8M6_PYGNA|nr:stonin-2 isoform X1 [Pygocentrus nattereri]XP_017570541.1 stonin-2 isoform X1 [Pygocentrus nattereri]XP_017570543.1 stonin-2 isoform X1 [Pygocentrus nattereri]